jgi:DNA repair protein RadC
MSGSGIPSPRAVLPSAADVELLAILLGGSRVGRQARARAVLTQAGSLWALRRWGPRRLRAAGVPVEAAVRLVAAFELAVRGLWPPADAGRLLGPTDSFAFVAPLLVGGTRERFLAVALDVKNRPLSVTVVAEGSSDTCPVDPREVFRTAVAEGASSVLVAHNHPSGDPTPSADDLVLTERLIGAGEVLGLPVIDHLVVGGGEREGEAYVSLVESGLWPARVASRRGRGHARAVGDARATPAPGTSLPVGRAAAVEGEIEVERPAVGR